MSKKLGLGFLLIFIIAAGVGYAIYSAPELPEHRLFNLAIKQFAANASGLENQFRSKSSIGNMNKQFTLDYSDLDKVQTSILVKMSVMNNLVTLRFGDGNTALANQTILLEPYFRRKDTKNEQVRWKCIGGSVLIRFRSKACRLGQGIVVSELLAN